MAWGYLTECVCGHVANHHGETSCHVAGCPCRSFKARGDDVVPVEEHNRVIRKANRIIKKQRERIAELESVSPNPEESKP
jgi:hypothetical protein